MSAATGDSGGGSEAAKYSVVRQLLSQAFGLGANVGAENAPTGDGAAAQATGAGSPHSASRMGGANKFRKVAHSVIAMRRLALHTSSSSSSSGVGGIGGSVVCEPPSSAHASLTTTMAAANAASGNTTASTSVGLHGWSASAPKTFSEASATETVSSVGTATKANEAEGIATHTERLQRLCEQFIGSHCVGSTVTLAGATASQSGAQGILATDGDTGGGDNGSLDTTSTTSTSTAASCTTDSSDSAASHHQVSAAGTVEVPLIHLAPLVTHFFGKPYHPSPASAVAASGTDNAPIVNPYPSPNPNPNNNPNPNPNPLQPRVQTMFLLSQLLPPIHK